MLCPFGHSYYFNHRSTCGNVPAHVQTVPNRKHAHVLSLIRDPKCDSENIPTWQSHSANLPQKREIENVNSIWILHTEIYEIGMV